MDIFKKCAKNPDAFMVAQDKDEANHEAKQDKYETLEGAKP